MLQYNNIQRFCLMISWLVRVDQYIEGISELLINTVKVMGKNEMNGLSKLLQHHGLKIGMIYLPGSKAVISPPGIVELEKLSIVELLNRLRKLKAYLELKKLARESRIDNFYNLYALLAGMLILVDRYRVGLIEWYSAASYIDRTVLDGELRRDYGKTVYLLNQFNLESDLPWNQIEYLPGGLYASPGLEGFVKISIDKAHDSLTKALSKLRIEFSIRQCEWEIPDSSQHHLPKRERRG